MEENKFEKQLRQKMDELKINPSDSVWEKIELRIGKKEGSNRKLFLLLLLFLSLFLITGYFLLHTGYHPITAGSNFGKKNSEKNTGRISIKEKVTGSGKTNNIPILINQKNNTVTNAALVKSGNKNSSKHPRLLSARRIIKINSGEKTTILLSNQQDAKDEISENPGAKPFVVQPEEIQPENEKINASIEAPADTKLINDSLVKLSSLQNENAKMKDTLQKAMTSPAIVKRSKKNTWKPGLLFSGGISGVGNDFLGLSNSQVYNYSSSGSQGTIPGPLSSPARTKSAFGFMAGVFAEKNISRRVKLSTGINFKSFHTSNTVGPRNDTTGFYNSRNAVNNSYDNHYNFIELPLTVKIRLGRGKNIPLWWQAGLIVSELINSNALQFDQSSGYYYSNNSIFNKTQIGLNTALSISLFSRQKNQVLIGPYFYYSASALANQGLYDKKHFVFTGLRTEIIFGK